MVEMMQKAVAVTTAARYAAATLSSVLYADCQTRNDRRMLPMDTAVDTRDAVIIYGALLASALSSTAECATTVYSDPTKYTPGVHKIAMYSICVKTIH